MEKADGIAVFYGLPLVVGAVGDAWNLCWDWSHFHNVDCISFIWIPFFVRSYIWVSVCKHLAQRIQAHRLEVYVTLEGPECFELVDVNDLPLEQRGQEPSMRTGKSISSLRLRSCSWFQVHVIKTQDIGPPGDGSRKPIVAGTMACRYKTRIFMIYISRLGWGCFETDLSLYQA